MPFQRKDCEPQCTLMTLRLAKGGLIGETASNEGQRPGLTSQLYSPLETISFLALTQ